MKDEDEVSKNGQPTLTDADIKATQPMGRRSMLRAIGGLAAATAVGAVIGSIAAPRRAAAQATDHDPNDRAGRGSDPAGHGRHCSDSDSTDGAGHGDHCSDTDQRH